LKFSQGAENFIKNFPSTFFSYQKQKCKKLSKEQFEFSGKARNKKGNPFAIVFFIFCGKFLFFVVFLFSLFLSCLLFLIKKIFLFLTARLK
jgi:hypothetical protein